MAPPKQGWTRCAFGAPQPAPGGTPNRGHTKQHETQTELGREHTQNNQGGNGHQAWPGTGHSEAHGRTTCVTITRGQGGTGQYNHRSRETTLLHRGRSYCSQQRGHPGADMVVCTTLCLQAPKKMAAKMISSPLCPRWTHSLSGGHSHGAAQQRTSKGPTIHKTKH